MTNEQAEAVIANLGAGSTMREAAAMARLPWRTFANAWTKGRAAFEQDEATEQADFYARASSARARHVATKRAEAAAVAGSRESQDLLQYVKALESEAEPLAEEDASIPSAVALYSHEDPAVREAAGRVLDANDDLLRALTADNRG